MRTVIRPGITAALVLGMGLLVAGCGPSAGSPAAPVAGGSSAVPSAPQATSGSSGPRVSDADAARAVCALFTRSQAQAVVGDTIKLADNPGPEFGTSGGVGLGSTCEWSTAADAGGLLALLVAVDDSSLPVARERPADHPAAERIKGNLFAGPKIEAVSGLGDEAIYSPSQISGGALFVRKGTKYIVIDPQTLSDAPPDIKQREIDLANAILPKL